MTATREHPNSVETHRFSIERVWNMSNWCQPPCCPNSWLIVTTDGWCVYLHSWTHLYPVADGFPGKEVEVVVERKNWKLLGLFAMRQTKLLEASIQGPPVPTEASGIDEPFWELEQVFRSDFTRIRLEELPPGFRDLIVPHH